MSKWTRGALLLLMAGAAQGCWKKCELKANDCDPECLAEDGKTTCMDPDPGGDTKGTQPGVIEKLSVCTGTTAKLTIPAPYFTVRTLVNGMPVEDPSPNKCEAFDIVWNVCNEGGKTFPATEEAYQVNMIEEVPPGTQGLRENLTPDIDVDLAPCECVLGFIASSGLQCNEPTVISNHTVMSSNLILQTEGFRVVP